MAEYYYRDDSVVAFILETGKRRSRRPGARRFAAERLWDAVVAMKVRPMKFLEDSNMREFLREQESFCTSVKLLLLTTEIWLEIR